MKRINIDYNKTDSRNIGATVLAEHRCIPHDQQRPTSHITRMAILHKHDLYDRLRDFRPILHALYRRLVNPEHLRHDSELLCVSVALDCFERLSKRNQYARLWP